MMCMKLIGRDGRNVCQSAGREGKDSEADTDDCMGGCCIHGWLMSHDDAI